MSTQITEWLEVVAKILLRCWIFGFVLLFIWLGAFLSGAVNRPMPSCWCCFCW